MNQDRESHAEQIARVRQMAVDEGDTWDLSANDVLALRTVLAERDELLAALQALVHYSEDRVDFVGMTDALRAARAAVAHAEGRS